MALQQLRSSTANKRPTAGAMSDGQLAVNTNATNPGLFFKDADGSVRKVGPVFIGSAAPNASPASGGSTGHSVGEQWLDNSGGTYVLKIWDGTAWRSESGTFVDVSGDTMTGVLEFVSGGASAPGIAFSGDTNTGIFRPGADQVAIATGGTAAVTVDASQNVGIGTLSPAVTAHIDSSSAESLRIQHASSPYQSFYLGANRGAFILSNSSNLQIAAESASNNTIQFTTNGNGRLYINSAGSVGIGTDSPSTRLQISDTVQATANNSYSLAILGDDGGTNGESAQIFLGAINATTRGTAIAAERQSSSNNHDLIFKTSDVSAAPTERMRIDSSGNVGIGTTSATDAKLVVANSTNGIEGIRINDTRATPSVNKRTFDVRYTGTNGRTAGNTQLLYLYDNNSSSTQPFMEVENGSGSLFVIDSSGKVGIGTQDPDFNLHVVGATSNILKVKRTGAGGTAKIRVENGDANYWDIANDGDESLTFGRNFSEKLRIDSSGRVLIGVTSNYANPNCDDLIVGNNSASGTRGITIGAADAGQIAFADAGDARAGILLYNHSDSSMRFYTSGASNERMRILSGGGLTFNGDTAQANALDDYEEGEFVATVTGKTNNVQLTLNSSRDRMRYIKVGNKVTIFGRIQVTAANGATGVLRFGGLPFANDANGTDESDYNALQVTWHGFNIPTDGVGQVFIELAGGNTAADLLYLRDNTGWAQLNVTALNFSVGVYFYVSGSYYSA